MRFHLNAIVLLGLIFVFSGCSEGGAVQTQSPAEQFELTDRVAMLMGGWPHAKAITESGKATAFRIKLDPDQDYKEVMLGEGIELTPEQRSELVGLLAKDDSYGWDYAKGCEPMPGVLVTFEDGATYARLRICFSCQMLGYKPGQWEDFDPINGKLVQWVKGVFPDDELIQKLGTEQQEHGL